MDKIIPLSEQNLTNDFLFKYVMENADIAKDVVECILQKEIERVEVFEAEKTLAAKYARRGIRLDVYLKDVNRKIYSIEMQTVDEKDLPKRIRYYQAQLDTSILPRGIDDYNVLNETIIIFICTFDPFGKGKYVYTFKNYCEEDTALTLNDGTVKMIISSKGNGQITKELKDFLSYIEKSTPEVAKGLNSPFIDRLSERVETIKRDKEMGAMYMLYEQRIIEAEAKGKRKGAKETVIHFFKEGLITATQAAEELDITVEEFLKLAD